MNPYEGFIQEFAQLIGRAKASPLGGFAPPPSPPANSAAPRVLIFSPHPDDEVIIGGLALRLRRELGWHAINVAVTQGSNRARQEERWQELAACCRHVGFDLLPTAPGGLEGINLKDRTGQPEQWRDSVTCIAKILTAHRPRAILFPHDDDWNVTHIGTHHLLADALALCPREFSCLTVETEFWGDMRSPNLMIESSQRDVTDLVTALSFHVGEVRRNPYHLRLPAWMMDNVRRGGELVGGQGAAAPDYLFATLYRLRRWQDGFFAPVLPRGLFLSQHDDLRAVFQA